MDILGCVDANNSIDATELTDFTEKFNTTDDDLSLIVEKEKDGNLRKLTISNCVSLESALDFINSSELKEELQHLECIFHIQFIIDDNIRELIGSDVEEIGKILHENLILVTFESSDCKQFLTLWSTKEYGHFLKLNSHKEVFSIGDKNFFKFINKFLLDSLKNCHLGLISTHSRSSDASNIDVQVLADSSDRNLYAIAAEQKNKEIQKYIAKNFPNLNIKKKTSFKREFCIISIGLISLICFVVVFGVLVSLLGYLLYDPEHSFETLSERNKDEVRNGLVEYTGVKVKLRDLFTDNSYAYNLLESDQIKEILNRQTLNFTAQSDIFEDFVELNWTNLNGNLRQKMLKLNVNFQGEKVMINSLYEIYKDAFKSLNSNQIERILNERYFEIGSKINYAENFYISRKFINEDIYAIYYEFRFKVTKESQSTDKVNFQEYYKNFTVLEFDQYNLKIGKIKANPNFQEQFYANFDTFFANLSNIQFLNSNETQIIEKVKESRIFIISGEAGVGKSLALEHVAVKFKEKYPLKWVSVINLSNYKNSFNFSTNHSNLNLFLEETLELTSENDFERKIFENSFKSNNVVLIWDGFDELTNNSSQILLEITKNIYETSKNIQLFGIRSSATKLLTKTFNTSAHLLVPFDEVKSEEFLKDYFISEQFSDEANDDDKALVQSHIEGILDLLHDLSESPKIPSDLTNPYILVTIADLSVANPSVIKSKKHLEIFSFIIKQKIIKWIFENDHAEHLYSDEDLNDRLFNIFQKFAIKAKIPSILNPLTQIYTKKLRVMKLNESSIVSFEEYTKMGILNLKGQKTFKFVHPIFVDFFVAQFIAKNMKNSNDIDSQELVLIIQFLFDILNSKPENNRLILKFLESFLQSDDDFEQFSSIIDVIKKFFSRNLFSIFKSNDFRGFKLLMELLKKNKDILSDMLQVNHLETLYTASFNPVYFSDYNRINFNRSGLMQIVKQSANLSAEDYESFLNGKDQKGVILYGLYYFRENFNITLDYGRDWVNNFETIKENFLSLGKTSSNTSNLTSNLSKTSNLHLNSPNNSTTIIQRTKRAIKLNSVSLLRIVLQNLTESEQKELFLSETTPIIDEQIIIKTYFWENAKEILTKKDEMKFLVIHILSRIHTFSNLKSEDFSNLLDKLGSYLNDKELFDVISRGNILHRAAGNHKIFKDLWKYFANRTNKLQQEKILSQTVTDECFGDHVIGQKCYDTPPLNIFYIALLFSKEDEMFNYVKDIYNLSISYREILNSNSIIPYSVLLCNLERFQNYLLFLETKFLNSLTNWTRLFPFLHKKIDETNSWIRNYFENINKIDKKLSLLNTLKNKTQNFTEKKIRILLFNY